MGSFLTGSPKGFDAGDFDRAGIRSQLITSALKSVQGGPEDQAGWLQLGAFGSAGVDVEQREEFIQAVSDVPRLARAVAAGADLGLWRAMMQPLSYLDPGEATTATIALARACRHLTDAEPQLALTTLAPTAVTHELVEVASIVAAAAGDRRVRAFADLLDGCAAAWPALRPYLHQMAGNIAASTPSARLDGLWRLQSLLGVR